MRPVLLEGGRPVVQGTDGFGVGAVELLAAQAANVDEAGLAQDAEVLGDGGLVQLQAGDDVAHGALVGCEEGEDLATAWFGDGVECVGGGGSAGHGRDNRCLYGNMSRDKW